MSAASQSGSFDNHKAAYAQWRDRMRNGVQSNKLIDLTATDREPAVSDEWSPDSLFVATADTDTPAVDADDELTEARLVVGRLLERVQAAADAD